MIDSLSAAMPNTGWWFVKHNDKEGWAPSSYLEPEDQSEQINGELADEIQVAPVAISGK